MGPLPTAAPFLFALSPNPARGDVLLNLRTAGEAEGALSIFDLADGRVRDLLKGRMPEGTLSVMWDGKDGANRAVPAGVYLARMQSNGGSVSQRIVIIR